MVRTSNWSCLIATVYESSICIQKTGAFLDVESIKESVENIAF